MSDTGRQSFTDKAGAALKPDSEKSTTEHLGDMFKGKTDSAATHFYLQSEKSTGQKMGDTFSSNSNEDSTSITQKAKNALGMGETR